ncbi:MAG: hypothetical protein UY87_C0028G0006 [Candidatus Peribacteria bacterium GW2011_GWC2_54_8]|nr:MAG: hypothetical protein UY87_C0028G0006 [Candidatus Peribacteria bacterium GW2011_GWC2_54_8]
MPTLPIFRMEKTFSLLATVSILCTAIPTSFAATLTRGDCNTLIGPAQNRCLRMQERKSEPTDAKQWRMENSNLIQERRLLRRPETGGRSKTITKSVEKLREESIEDLRFQDRYEQRDDWRETLQQERMNALRTRFSSTPRSTALDQSELRSRSERQHDRTQTRRDAIKRAHEACRDVSATERQQCLRQVRDEELGE